MTINVKDFGAQGNGVNNDTAAIQSAIASLAAKGGGTVFFPEGTYNVTTINLNVRGVKLQGSGWTGTRIQGTSPVSKIINVTTDFCGVEGMQIEFNGVTPENMNAIGVYSKGNELCVRDVKIQNIAIGVYLDNAVIAYLENFYIQKFSQAAIYMDHWIDVYCTNFIIEATEGAQHGKIACWYVKNGCDAILASNGDILSGRHALKCEGASSGMQYSAFTNICFDSAYEACVALENSKMNKFTNCWFSGGRENVPSPGMIIGTSQDTRFVNCDFSNNGGDGACVKDTNINTKFIGCTFDSNSYKSGVGISHGLSIWPNAKWFTITDCTFRNGSFSGQQGFGCLVNYGNSDKYHIVNNFFQNNTIVGLSDGGQGSSKVVSGNL